MASSRASRISRLPDERAGAPKTITLARNLARVREWRGIDVEELSRAASMSREDLRDVEAARRAPTIEELWAIAKVLGVPYARLLRGDFGESAPRTGRPTDAQGANNPNRRLLRRSGVGPALRELYQLKLAPRSGHVAEPRDAGSTENILVTRGRAVVEVDGISHDVAIGDGRTVRADVPRTYRNTQDEEAVIYVMISNQDAGPSASLDDP